MSIYTPPRLRKTGFNFSPTCKKNRVLKLLPTSPPSTRNALQWDEADLLSFTPQHISNCTCKKLLHLPGISEDSVITDAMAGVGGNTIAFAQRFKHVNAIELNGRRFRMLNGNISLFGLHNITVKCDYYQNNVESVQQDIIYMDPPWGLDYKQHKNLRIVVDGPMGGNTGLENLICSLRQHTKYIVVKLPINYDMRYLSNVLRSHNMQIIDSVYYPKPFTMTEHIIKCENEPEL